MSISNIDEFGRDMSLRKPMIAVVEDAPNYYLKFKGKSWAEIQWECEEEEELALALAEAHAYIELVSKLSEMKMSQPTSNLDQSRAVLYAAGEYDAEEGEIFE